MTIVIDTTHISWMPVSLLYRCAFQQLNISISVRNHKNINLQWIYLSNVFTWNVSCLLLSVHKLLGKMHILITVKAALAFHAVKWHYCIIHRENLMIIVSAGSGSKNTVASGVTCNYLDIWGFFNEWSIYLISFWHRLW